MSEKTTKKKNREEIETEVRQKVDCEEQAFRWVEHLAIVDNITKEKLMEMVCEITRGHYNDITEERAISKVCGYPLCSVKLGKRSAHKYHISTKHNKVIDLSVRENFCSLYCYQASKFVENQIPETPIWLRGEDFDLKLLQRKEKVVEQCGIGEIPLGRMTLNDIESEEKEDDDSDEEKEAKSSYTFLSKGVTDDNSVFQDGDEEIDCKTFEPSETQKNSKEHKQTKLIDHKDIIKRENKETQHYIDKVTSLLKEWVTKKSFYHLNCLSTEPYDSDDDNDNIDGTDSCVADSAAFQAKVANFLSRQPEWISETSIGEQKNSAPKKNKYTLPSIDSRSQNSIRRRIVHEKLNSSLREVLPVCGLFEEDLTQVGFFKLVDTFSFNSKNIVLNLKEWHIMTIVLLKIILKMYRKDFGNMNNRHNDINEFLIMRNLPNVSQIDEFIKTILDVLNNFNNSPGDDAKKDAGTNETEDLLCYYSNMEEVD